ncbi:hypothetical protein HDR66_02635 [bacterium]|nr:hypothetical protein [bacterium]
MNKHTLFLGIILLIAPGIANAAAASCSKASLTRCLDSVCAINSAANPAARCQYCGTSSAGEPPAKSAMKSVSAGASSKNTLTDKELKSAPSDPGERYTWATTQCLKKVANCTPDDVSATYDSLIEQSCRAAGVSAQMATLRAAANKKKTKTSCQTDITTCLTAAKYCNADYSGCSSEADFDKFFAACSVEATGCDEYVSTLRTELFASRNDSIKGTDEAIDAIVLAYQDARKSKLAKARADCTDNAGRDACVTSVCERSMPNKCATGSQWEKSAAIQLCKFYDVACATLK